METADFLLLALVPGILGAAGAWALGRLGKGVRTPLLVVLLGCAAALGAWLALDRRWPAFPPHQAWQWALWAVVAGVLLGLVEWRAPLLVRWGLRLVASGLAARALLAPLVPHALAAREALLLVPLAALGVLLPWGLLGEAGRRGGGGLAVAGPVVAGAAASAATLLSGAMVIAKATGAVTAALAGVAAGTLLLARRPVPSALAPGAVLPLVLLLLGAHAYAELPLVCVLLLVAAIVGGVVVPRAERPDERPALSRLLLQVAVALIPAALAVYLAAQASPPFDPYAR